MILVEPQIVRRNNDGTAVAVVNGQEFTVEAIVAYRLVGGIAPIDLPVTPSNVVKWYADLGLTINEIEATRLIAHLYTEIKQVSVAAIEDFIKDAATPGEEVSA